MTRSQYIAQIVRDITNKLAGVRCRRQQHLKIQSKAYMLAEHYVGVDAEIPTLRAYIQLGPDSCVMGKIIDALKATT